MESQPIACRLTGVDLQDRRAWIAELTRDALRGYERADLTLNLRYALQAMQRVKEMVSKERACCSFLSFEIREQADEVLLTIEAPEDAGQVVDTLFASFLPSLDR